MYTYKAKTVKVVDGDTYDFNVDLGFHTHHKIRVRLQAFDTPEPRSKNTAERVHAKKATELASKLLFGSVTVTLKTKKDKIGIYGRYTAQVTLSDGNDLASELRIAGMGKLGYYVPDEKEE
ncbi:MAG: nuclease [Pseudomonadales bacterium]|nr:nuclease [Pseudomonadales bacterium]|tara:strand:+ start:31 stop:393 length:363 start_codon:yes stop_codon:yes gene_type:complete